MHHQFRHPCAPVARRAEVEVAHDRVRGVLRAARLGTGHQEMLGAVVPEFAQHLFADGPYPIEFGCRRDQLAHCLLLRGGQRGAPVRRGH